MAEDQSGLKKDYLREFAPWTKLFSAFKVAMDPKKLLLAGAGILAMALGWWLLAALYFGMNPKPPKFEDYKPSEYSGTTDEEKQVEAWKAFKEARRSWNLLYEMAGPVPSKPEDAEPYLFDAADYADSLKEYELILVAKKNIDEELSLRDTPVTSIVAGKTNIFLQVGDNKLQVEGKKEDIQQVEDWIKQKRLRLGDIRITGKNKALEVTIKDKTFKVFGGEDALAEDLKLMIFKARVEEDILREAARGERDPVITRKALDLRTKRLKPAGKLQTLPWFENRGPNPYLLVTGNVKVTSKEGTVRNVPWERGEFITWLGNDQAPVLLEPLFKFLRPVAYLLDPAAGGWNRIYLFLVILWTLVVWGFFGGAITRMAAVQVARPNEKVSLTDSVRFAYQRYKSFFLAPLFPLLFLVGMTVFLMLFGFFEKLLPGLGDIVLAGLLWPLYLVVGLLMAIVLVGLVGWPLMYPTISTEGSDSFDAISRSYSYIYQAPWQYVWYIAVSILYGAVLIFFVGLMGSLTVYLSKWGISQAWQPIPERDPEYLYMWAPTSFGWRDLLLYKSPNMISADVVLSSGQIQYGGAYALSDSVVSKLAPWNYIGTFFVSVWLYILFLLVVGFGYSYFWSASTIIYILMRRNVDDTEMDEVHLEQAEPEVPYPTPPTTATGTVPSPTPPASAKPGSTNLTLVEPPTLRPPANPTMLAPPTPPTPLAPTVPPTKEPSEPASAAPVVATSDKQEPTPTPAEAKESDGDAKSAKASESAVEEKKP